MTELYIKFENPNILTNLPNFLSEITYVNFKQKEIKPHWLLLDEQSLKSYEKLLNFLNTLKNTSDWIILLKYLKIEDFNYLDSETYSLLKTTPKNLLLQSEELKQKLNNLSKNYLNKVFSFLIKEHNKNNYFYYDLTTYLLNYKKNNIKNYNYIR